MNSRIELMRLVPINGFVAEIGTLEGTFGREIKTLRPDINLFCIDNWLEPHEKAEAIARRTLETIPGVLIHKDESTQAAQLYEDEYFDLVYIDADHTFMGCTNDILAWYPKVKRGGYLSGHDYEEKAAGDGWHTAIEVKRAVSAWAWVNKLDVGVVYENAPSWYVKKP